MPEREKEIKRTSWISIIGNALLALIKIVFGLVAGSLAVVADGIDSFEDVIASLITLIAATVMSRPPNIKYPYGYGKAETIATRLLAIIIFFAGIELAIIAVRKIISSSPPEISLRLAIVVTIISIIGKIFMSIYHFRTGRRINSQMLIANAKNMQNDVIISLSVLTGLIFTYIFKMPVIDSIAALIVSVWILKVAIKIFLETNRELMDGTKDFEIYERIFKAIDSVKGVQNPHRVRVRKIGYKLKVGVDIEVDGNLSLKEAHEISHKVDQSIRNEIDNLFDVSIHVEPIGDRTEENKYGISRESL
jgi:cation diffusion facilitator family transporter